MRFLDEWFGPQKPHTLWFFDHNSTNPVTTYADKKLTIPNTHPVVADADGVFGSIFVTEDRAQLKVLTDCVLQDFKGRTLVIWRPLDHWAFLGPKNCPKCGERIGR